jgi:hypothetical protein
LLVGGPPRPEIIVKVSRIAGTPGWPIKAPGARRPSVKQQLTAPDRFAPSDKASRGSACAGDAEDIRSTCESFVTAQNAAHDTKAVTGMLKASDDFLWITRGTLIRQISCMITYSVFRLAARRTDRSVRDSVLEAAPVSEKRVALNRSPRHQGYGY